MNLQGVLKRYDKLLNIKECLDGTKKITRKSPFYSEKEHDILNIRNQYIGSGSWVLKALTLMDTTRFDIVGGVLRHNWSLREPESNRAMHQELASLIRGGGSFIN